MTGMRQKWVELLCLGMGFPVLLALVLAGGGLPQRIAFESIQDSADLPPSSKHRPADPAATVDLAGWRVFIHAATPEFSSLGPAAAAEPLADAVRRLPGSWADAPAVGSAALRFYRSQAPPSPA